MTVLRDPKGFNPASRDLRGARARAVLDLFEDRFRGGIAELSELREKLGPEFSARDFERAIDDLASVGLIDVGAANGRLMLFAPEGEGGGKAA